MTFSIIGRCRGNRPARDRHQFLQHRGGRPLPLAAFAGVGAVATQNITLPSLGPQILDLLRASSSNRRRRWIGRLARTSGASIGK